MRWQSLIAALGLGMLGGAGWVWWDGHGRQAAPVSAAAPDHRAGDIPLTVQHEGRMLKLQWNPATAEIRNAAHGTLTITDGEHHSTLNLDGPELRAGLASYWPEGSRVGFRLDTAEGASGSVEVPAEPRAAAVDAKAEEPEKPAAPRAISPRRRSGGQPSDRAGDRGEPVSGESLNDGLEWTTQPPRPSPFGDEDRAAPKRAPSPPAPRYRSAPAPRVPRSQFRPSAVTRSESHRDSRWTRLKRKFHFLHRAGSRDTAAR